MGMPEGVLQDPEKAVFWYNTLNQIFEMFPVLNNFYWAVNLMQMLPLWVMERLNPPFAILLRFYDVRCLLLPSICTL